MICTWYDRLVRTRDFYILDREFNQHGIEFIALYDPTVRKADSTHRVHYYLPTSDKPSQKLYRNSLGCWSYAQFAQSFQHQASHRQVDHGFTALR
jgi:hypothetical protein